MATKDKNEIEKREEMLPDVYDYGQDAGVGYEGTSQDDYAIPMLLLLQGLSPQVKEDGVEGAKPGMLFNSVTQELYSGKDGVVFVPAHREHVFIEWVPRKKGGGFVGVHSRDSEIVRDAKSNSTSFGEYYTKNGNELKETFLLYGLVIDEETNESQGPAVISFTSTKIKAYKKTMSAMRQLMLPAPGGKRINPPIFANQLRIKSRADKNEKGDFYVLDIGFRNGSPKDSVLRPGPLMLEAKDFAAVVKEGSAKVDHASAQDDGKAGFGDGDGDETVPF